MRVPCCRCMSCRIRRRAEWTVRLYHELDEHEDAAFVTLTYDDSVLPPNASLVKRDLQLFHKRLRFDFKKRIKYYAVGEYGRQTQRPHYHGIYFGLPILSHGLVSRNWLSDCRVHIGSVTRESIQYVAGYIEDKLYGDLADEEYTAKGREPPFNLMSHGLGKKFAEDNIDRILKDGYVTINGRNVGLPRYYKRVLDIAPDYSGEVAREYDNKIARHFGVDRPIDILDCGDAIARHSDDTATARVNLYRDLSDLSKF